MAGNGPHFVAAPPMLLPAGSVALVLSAADRDPPRLFDATMPTAEKVTIVSNALEPMTPHSLASWFAKTIYRAPLLAAQVRIELKKRSRVKKQAAWRKTARDKRTAAAAEKRAAAAENPVRSVRPRADPAKEPASSSGSGAAADGGRFGRDLAVASSSFPGWASAPPSPGDAAAASGPAASGPATAAAATPAVGVEPDGSRAEETEGGSSAGDSLSYESDVDYAAALFGDAADQA